MTATLLDRLSALAAYGDRPAIRRFGADGGSTVVTYAELDAWARRLAAGLRAQGAGDGAYVGIYAPNSPDWLAARLAILFAGGVGVSLDTDLTPDALAQQLTASGARMVLTVRANQDALVQAGLGELDVRLLDAETNDLRALSQLEADPITALPAPDPDGVASLFFTSGTTGPPKGVPLTHRNIAHNVDALRSLNVVEQGDGVLLPLPLHHSYPFIVGMLTPLATGATIVLPAGVSGPEIRDALGRGQVRVVVGVPRLYSALAEGLTDRLRRGGALEKGMYALLRLSTALRARVGWRVGRTLLKPLHARLAPELETLASGGARLDPDAARTLEGFGWQVLSGYGLVETASIATFNPPGRNRIGSAGLPAPGMAIDIDTAVLSAEGDTGAGDGEIRLKGASVFPGYTNRPEANAEAFSGDGWFRTGDVGHLDRDGYLWITGRAKEMIVLPDGKNVAPETVEAVYAESPYIREIAVLERSGALVGLVVPEMEALREASGSVADLIRISLAEQAPRLPAYKRLSDWALTRETLPRTLLGKYQRHKLAPIFDRAARGEQAEEAADAGDDALRADPMAAAVLAWLRERFPDKPVTPATSPQLDLGVDSLAWVTMTAEMEDRFGIVLSEAAIARSLTVRDLLREVTQAPRRAEGAGARGEEDLPRWLRDGQTAGERAAAAVLHGLVRGVAGTLFRLRVHGVDHLPERGPAVIAANHLSDLDVLVLSAALPGRYRPLVAWGADRGRLFDSHWGRLLARVANLFPVDDRAPRASIDAAVRVLGTGRIVVWFPEEFRSPDGALQPFKAGIGRILAETGAPVVPCAITGTDAAMPRGARWPKPAATSVRFGAPVPAAELGHEPEAIAAKLRAHVAQLLSDVQERDIQA